MKHSDIQKIHDAGLISDQQRQDIIAHFGLKEESSRFFAIVSMIGAVLVLAGIVLLISANWEDIPRGIKIAAGIVLMLGAHAGGWWLREVRGEYRKTGEALHFIGAGLFLANIALIGQIYHLVSRPPNALLLWLAGIAALPWLLRSKALHFLVLAGFGIWFGMEINERDSLVYFGGDQNQLLVYSLMGLIYLGFGYVLRRTRFADFAKVTERLGMLGMLVFAYPLTWGIWADRGSWLPEVQTWIFPKMCVAALALVAAGMSSLKHLDRQWRLTWGLSLAGIVALLAGQLYLAPHFDWSDRWHESGYHWIAAVGLFVFCLLQIQVGILERSRFMVNLGIAFIALDIFATYLRLIGSMGRTGTMFLISGVFLIVFAVYLEKKRRKLMRQIKATKASPEAIV
ncbi:MAG TPA: DUF2157 domain-containing protein [Verrucomicrobiota bacterium]|nr:DUF2157 domain-containing protein [Verrucomicrobiota bacterium]